MKSPPVNVDSSRNPAGVSRVRVHRTAQGLDQRDLARLAGVSLKTVSNVERGTTRPRSKTAHAIAVALGVQLDDLWPVDQQR